MEVVNMIKKNIFFTVLLILVSSQFSISQQKEFKESIEHTKSWAYRIAESFLIRHPGSVTYDQYMTKESWNYEQGVMLEAMKKMYEFTGEEKYFKFIKGNIDQYVDENGNIRTYPYKDFNLDKINSGRALLFLFDKTKIKKYKIAADTLRKQIENQPRTVSGGFWHKKIYPFQMWLDGLFMASPFYAQYSQLFDEDNYEDIFNQFNLVYEKTVDQKTGLLYHAWNENKEQKWANKQTGRSPHFWGRAMGWYLMAIVDVLDFIPNDDERRKELYTILANVSEALLKYKDCETGLWYQVIDMPDREGNYLEASCAAMFTYAMAKGANKGYIGSEFLDAAKESFNSILNYHVKVDENGFIDLYNTCSAAGLGGNPYRDGSFAYYISEPTRKNDFKGYGPLLYSAIEIEKAENKNNSN
jgi:unsaturated rhamnogalacturonyl hydrolase